MASINREGNCSPVYVPQLSFGGGPYRISKWLASNESNVSKNDPVVEIWCNSRQAITCICAMAGGKLIQDLQAGAVVTVGQRLGVIYPLANSVSSIVEQLSSSSITPASSSPASTQGAVRSGALSPQSGTIPTFIPSTASVPAGFAPSESHENELAYAIENPYIGLQSFFNDLDVLNNGVVNDDVVRRPAFDEAIYCALVKEMHRFSLAEISDNRERLASDNAGLGTLVGRRVEEFLPDPTLLFYQDENSFLSWTRAQVNRPRLRRLIFDRQIKDSGEVFYRIIPAIVTPDSVFPVQLFKIDPSTYFYRPVAAGIKREQRNYDAIRIQNKYCHFLGLGAKEKSSLELVVQGRDIEPRKEPIWKDSGPGSTYFYIDFQTPPSYVF